jgi:hypothetical protein
MQRRFLGLAEVFLHRICERGLDDASRENDGDLHLLGHSGCGH